MIVQRCGFLGKNSQDSLISTLIEAKGRNTVRKEVAKYLDQLKQITTRGDFEIHRYTMQNYIGGPTKINTMFFLLKKETQTRSKTAYLDVMDSEITCHMVKNDFIAKEYKAGLETERYISLSNNQLSTRKHEISQFFLVKMLSSASYMA